MRATSRLVLVALALVVTFGCAGRQTYMVPPRIDLTQHEMIGVIDFSASSEGELGPLATRRFMDEARRDQGLVRIVGFGSQDEALRSVGSSKLSPETFKTLGSERGVRTIVVGELAVSDIRPDLRVGAALRSGTLSAKVDATLTVQLIETATGASIWSTSARATRSIGHISVFNGGDFVFDADDPDRAYGPLVDTLVAQVTQDFRVTWERR